MLLSQASTMQGSALSSLHCSARLTPTRPVGRVFAPVVAAAKNRVQQRQDRHRRLRKKLTGTTERPRLAVFRSNNHIYAQVIDDTVGLTLASANTLMKVVKEVVNDNTANKEGAVAVGKKIAELCAAKGILKVAFDRGGFDYHGRVQAVAEAAREGGLQF